MRQKRLLLALLGTFGLLLFLAVVASAEEPQYGGELIYAHGVDPSTLFVGNSIDSTGMEFGLYAYETLVEIGEGNTIVPWLATNWEFSEDGLTCTMWLRENVLFSDGTPFNAEAVKFVYDTILENKYMPYLMLEGVEEIEAKSEYVVAFHFEEPIAAFLPNIAYRSLSLWSPTAYKENGIEWMNSHMVGTGPFLLDEWRHGEYMRFVKNPDYWQPGLPYLDAIKIMVVPDTSVRTMMLESGAVDRATSLSDFELDRLESDPNILIRAVPSTRQFYAGFNCLVHPLDNVLVRRALNYAIDKQGIVDSVFAGVGASVPQAPILSAGVVGFTDMTEPGEDSLFPYDPDKAMQLLANAGYVDRDGDGFVEDLEGQKLSISYWTPNGRYKGDAQVSELVHTMLRAVGVDASLRSYEWATFMTLISLPPEESESELFLISWGIPTADPDEPMLLMFPTSAWKPHGGNRMFYSNEEVDQLAVAAHHAVDPDERKALIVEWAKILIDEAPIIFLPNLNLNIGSRTYLHGDQILPIELYPARFAWLDAEEMQRQGIVR